MRQTSCLIRKQRITTKYNEINRDLSFNEQIEDKSNQEFNCLQDSNFEFYVSETSSMHLTEQNLNLFGDITENLDSVYSLNSRIPNPNLNQISSRERTSKPVRYTVKRDKDLKKKKQRSSAKKFSLQEDKQLLTYILKKGPKFHKFSRYFQGKTTNMLKNRYYKTLRFNWSQIMGSQYAHLDAEIESPDAQSTPLIQEGEKICFENIPELNLFPKAEELLVNFVSSLTKTFVSIQQGELQNE